MAEPTKLSTAKEKSIKATNKFYESQGYHTREKRPDGPLITHDLDARSCADPMTAAMFRSPITEIFDTMLSLQGKEQCGKIEVNMLECLEAYGLPRGNSKCADYIDDHNECTSNFKQFQRMRIMRDERARQHRMGERKIKYAMPPRMGSYEY